MPNKLTIEEFITKAISIHGDTYDYSQVNYQRSTDNVTFICKLHGEFSATPKNHLKGRSCPMCGNRNRSKNNTKSSDKFLDEAGEIHRYKYDYSDVNYIRSNLPVKIRCPEHGFFYQQPNNHLMGKGCNVCATIIRGDKLRLSVSDIVDKFKDTHGDRYDYTMVRYTSFHDKVAIRCLIHGVFHQTPASHISGSGCRECANQAPKGTKVYVMEMSTTTEHFGKVGIMKDTIDKRFPGWKNRGDILVHSIIECHTTECARELEREFLNIATTRTNPDILHNWRGGFTEAFDVKHLPQILNYGNEREQRSDPTGEKS